jgi:hypothetical protein
MNDGTLEKLVGWGWDLISFVLLYMLSLREKGSWLAKLIYTLIFVIPCISSASYKLLVMIWHSN